MYYSSLTYNSSKDNSQWNDKLIKVWVQRWYESNIWLPDKFERYRESVMKKVTSLPWILGNMNVIADLSINCRFFKDDLEEVASIWDCVCSLPYYYVKLMAEHRYNEVKNYIYKDIVGWMEKGNIKEAYKIYKDNKWIRKVCSAEEYEQVGAYLRGM